MFISETKFRLSRISWFAGFTLFTLVIWEIGVKIFSVKTFILPAPSLIFFELVNAPLFYFKHGAYTLLITLIGFFFSIFFGVLLAISIVYSKVLDKTITPALVSFNAVPKVALAPLFVIWLGTEWEPKVAIAFLISIFPIVIDAILGLRSIDPDMLNLAKSCRSSKLKALLYIRFPNALPSIFTGFKVGVSFALIGAVVGEFVAGDTGLGFVILQSQGNFDTPRVFASLAVLGALGTILFYGVEALESKVIPWHVSKRGLKREEIV